MMADLHTLRSKRDPTVTITGPVDAPYDKTLWEPVGPEGDTRSGVARFLQETATPAVAGVLKAPTALLPEGSGGVGRRAWEGFSEGAARFVVPQNEAELGMMLGTGGAGALAGLTRLATPAARAARILGAGAGSAMGENFRPGATIEDVGQAGFRGLAGGALGEGVGAGLGMIRRGLPNMGPLPVGRQGVNRADVRNVGRAIDTSVEPLAGEFRTVDDVIRVAKSPMGKRVIGDAFGESVRRTDNLIGNAQLTIPTINPDRPITLGEVGEWLMNKGRIGYAGRQADPTTRTSAQLPTRQEYRQAMNEVRAELVRLGGPDAAIEWEQGRRMYTLGDSILNMLRQPGVVRGGANIREVDMNALRRQFEKRLPRLADQYGLLPEDIQSFQQALYRGAATGTRDEPAPGFGRFLESVFRMFQGKDTGATQYLFGTARAIYPNPTRYTGTPPFTPGGAVQTPIDIGAGLLSHRLMQGRQ